MTSTRRLLWILVLLATPVAWAKGDLKPPPGYAVETLSAGKPSRGILVNGVPFPPGIGYTFNSAVEHYATPEAVEAILFAIGQVRERYADTADLVIGDLSYPKGGKISHHRSHRSGRDADLGMYLKGNQQPRQFAPLNLANIDVPKTWTLIQALIEDNKVEVIFLDTRIQAILYLYAKNTLHASASDLERLFQYPHGRHARCGIFRWAMGHTNHMHVRFRCPRAVAAAEKYSPVELARLHAVQPARGFVAVAGAGSGPQGDEAANSNNDWKL